MTPVPVTAFNHLVNKKTSVVSTPTANFRADRYTTAAILKAFPTGTVFIPTCQATDGTSVAGSALWYGGFMLDDSPAGYGFGWFHASVVAPLADNLPLIEGATPAQVALAVKVATDPLNAKISAAMHDLA